MVDSIYASNNFKIGVGGEMGSQMVTGNQIVARILLWWILLL